LPDGLHTLAYLSIAYKDCALDFFNDVVVLLVDAYEQDVDETVGEYNLTKIRELCGSEHFYEWMLEYHRKQVALCEPILQNVDLTDCSPNSMTLPNRLLLRVDDASI
jgi:hypothetical protein